MTTATTQINITAKDSTAAAFASANSNLSGLASTALKTTSALSAIGAGAFVGSMAAFTKQTIDAQDELFKLSQKTGIAVESLAGLEFAAEQSGVELEKVAKATRAFSLLVAESADSSSEAANKLQQLGLSYKDLKDLSPEKQLLALAEALSKFGKEDRAVALTATLGQKMADLIPLLSGGSKGLQELIDQGKKLNPVTEQSARQAEQFNDQLNLLNKTVSALGREFVQGMIPGLTAVSTKMVEVTQQSGFLAGALAGVKELFVQSFGNPKILGDVGQIRREIFKTQEVIAQMSTKKDSIFFDKNALAHEQEKLVQLQTDLQNAIVKSRDVVAVQDANTVATKKFAIALDEGNKQVTSRAAKVDSLAKKMNDQTRIEEEYVKLLVIERKAQQDLLRPYEQSAKSAEERLDAMRQESAAMSLSQTKQISLEHAIEETTIARLEEKKAITKESGAVAAIDKEIAARKQIIGVIQSSQASTKQLTQTTRNTTDEVSQLWMQAGRNIQSSLANGIFNFFDDGLKGMVKNVISTVGRIASEFAALKLAQNIGLGSMFTVGGIGGTGSKAMDIASLGSNLASVGRGGFGLNSLVGGGLGRLGGSIGAFGGGLAGTGAGAFSAAGGAGTAFIGGAGTALGGSGMGVAAGLGASMSALAGPLAALAAGFMGGKFIAGEKKIAGIGGTEAALIGTALGGPVGAVVAGSILALFGRGPFKFRQQSLQGTASSEGFDGDITNVERAKGGLLRSNAHRSTTVQLTNEMQDTFDTAIGAYYKSAHSFAESLGLDVNLVDGFTKEFQIKSEKGKQLTGEAVTEMVAGIGDSLAQNLLPIVDTLKKAGENSFQALARLSGDFDALAEGAVNLGASMQYARDLLKSSTFEGREAFIKAAGGIDALAQKTKFFSETFLNDAEQLAPAAIKLSETMQGMGLSVDMTGEQFKSLVQSFGQVNGITEETLQTLLNIAPAYVTVNNLFKVLEEGIINLGGSAEFARQAVSGLSVDTRLAYLDAAGGAAQFATDTANFNRLYFTAAENMAADVKFVEEGLKGLGISADLTKDQFRDLVQTLLTSSSETDVLTGILLQHNNVLFASVADYKESIRQLSEPIVKPKSQVLDEALTGLQNSVDAERKRITNTYNNSLAAVNARISNITESLGKLNALSQSVKTALSALNPISLKDARARVSDAISAVKGGKSFDQNSVQEALAKISEKNTSGFSDRNSFLRDQAKSTSLVDQLSSVTTKQISTQEKMLGVAEASREQLEVGFDRQISALDQILIEAKNQVDATKGLDTTLLSLVDALGRFNNASVDAGGGTVTPSVPSVVRGNSKITSNDIRGFAATHSPIEIYREAVKRGVSKEQVAASGVASIAEIDKFLKDNKLASFDVGGMVPKTGLALIHKNERIINPQQNDEIVDLLKKLIPGATASKDLYQLLKNMSSDGLSLKTQAAA